MTDRFSLLLFTTVRCLLLFAGITGGASSFAQRYPFYNLNIENGLVQSQALNLVQDQQGHLWIGTLGGLSRFDGKTFTNYTVRNGLLTNQVNTLAIDSAGLIWIGSPRGLSSFDGKQFHHYQLQPAESRQSSVYRVAAGTGNTIYCKSGRQLYRIAKGSTSRVVLPDASEEVTSFCTRGSQLDVATFKGMIYHWDGKGWDSTRFPGTEATEKVFIRLLLRDRKNRLWMSGTDGLYVQEGRQIRQFRASGYPDFVFPPLTSAAEDKEGNIWLGASSGAIRVNDSGIHVYNRKNGLTDNVISALLCDEEGNIWLASDGQGVFRFSGAPIVALDESMGLPSAQIMSIAATSNGDVFLGAYDAGLFVYREHSGVRPLPLPGNGKPLIPSLTTQRGHIVWIATRGEGLYRYENGRFTQYTQSNYGLPSNLIGNLYVDSDDQLWVGFLGAGFGKMGRDSFIDLSGSYANATINAFLEIGKDSMLVADNESLYLCSHGRTARFRTNGPVDVAIVQCMARQGDDIWFGTSDNGIVWYNRRSGKSVVFNKSNGLHSDFIYNIITDNEGNIWAGTGYGIHKLSFRTGKPEITFFGRGQGVIGLESNHNAIWKMNDGSLWFGTTGGALHYRPNADMVQARPTGLVLQSVRVFGEDIRDSSYYSGLDPWYGVPKNLKLPYRKNNITFTFQGISLSGADGLLYRYRIEGLDAPWSDWSTTTSVTFSAVPSGKYILRIQCSTDGKSIQETLAYPFEIITPFHKTGLFRLIILGGCILLGISIQYIANLRKRNREQLLETLRREEQNKVRQRTAEDFHDEVGNKLTRINVLTNVLKAKISNLGPETLKIIDQIQDNTGQLYTGTRDILWSLKPSNDNLYEILFRIRDFGVELFQYTDIDFLFTGADDRWKSFRLPLDYSRNLTMIFKEALNNSLKYAGATTVQLEAQLDKDNYLTLHLQDNGKGFSIDQVKRGHGIDNMNVRARRLGGTLKLEGTPGKGTEIVLRFKIPSNKG